MPMELVGLAFAFVAGLAVVLTYRFHKADMEADAEARLAAIPPPIDDHRLAALEAGLASTTRQLETMKTAVALKQLR